MELVTSARAWLPRRLGAAVTVTAILAAPSVASADRPRMVDVLVSTTTGATATVERTVRDLGGAVTHRLGVIDGFSARLPQSAVATLTGSAGVAWVSPNRRVQLEGQYGQDSGVASAVYTDVVRASKDWSAGVTGAGVTVALVDTGVNTSGDLAGRVVHAEDFTGEADNHDNYGHGTFVAGLIAGTGAASGGSVRGVAPGAKLVSLKIAGRDGSTDVTRVLEALEWIVDYRDVYGIRVVNLSLGFSGAQSYHVDPLDFAVERVWNDGIVVVTAAGNGDNAPHTITSPGNDPLVLTVGASDDRTTQTLTDDKLAAFSSVGPTSDNLAKPDVLAPGRSVVSSRSPGSYVDTTYPSSQVGTVYTRGSGTSFSTGVASGVAALVIQHNWSLSPNQVKHRIVAGQRPMGLLTSLLDPTALGEVDAYAATFSTSKTAANAGVTPAAGGGSLQATRGEACLRYPNGTCMSDADANAAVGFAPAPYFANKWAGNTWNGSLWVSCRFKGSQWTGSQWTGSQWVSSGPAASDWAGSQWVGSQWVGSQWTGSQWVGSQWVGSQWVSSGSTDTTDSGGLLSGLLAPATAVVNPGDLWAWLP